MDMSAARMSAPWSSGASGREYPMRAAVTPRSRRRSAAGAAERCTRGRRRAAPRLVRAAAVVDDEDVTGLGLAERLEEHVHAAVVPSRKRASGEPPAGDDRADPRRRGPQRYADPDEGVRHERRGEVGEPLDFQTHGATL